MSDRPSTKGPHDVGGEAAGPVDTTDHGMKFWEKQANALRSTVTGNRLLWLDELRRAAEDLGDEYHRLDYFERTTMALRNVLVEKGLIGVGELETKMAEVRRRYDVPDEMESPIKQRGTK